VPGPSVVERLLVRPDLDRIFDYRADQLNGWVLATHHSLAGVDQAAAGALWSGSP
jgi:hypothetical protein